MPDAFARGRLGGFSFQAGEGKSSSLAWVTPAPVVTPGLPLAPPTPALVAHTQGGLTLGPERGELAADFWSLGKKEDELSARAKCEWLPEGCTPR